MNIAVIHAARLSVNQGTTTQRLAAKQRGLKEALLD